VTIARLTRQPPTGSISRRLADEPSAASRQVSSRRSRRRGRWLRPRRKMAALNSATSSNAIDPNAEDNCDDAETGNAQESNGYEELPELQAVVIDRALHDELTAGPTRPTERLLKGQRAPATCPLPKPRCSPRSVTNGIRRRRRGGHATRCLWRSHISHSQDRYRRFTGRDNCRGRSYVLLAHGLRVSSPRSG
jgi:hypothetical protein